MNSYKISSGERICRHDLDTQIKLAKAKKLKTMLDEFGYIFCEDCYRYQCKGLGMEYNVLDCSHDIPVSKCLSSGRAELAYNVDNITVRCRHHHELWDKKH